MHGMKEGLKGEGGEEIKRTGMGGGASERVKWWSERGKERENERQQWGRG